MPIYVKSAGTWQTGRPYIKLNGAWVPLNEVNAKYAGAWTNVFRYDVTPPVSPGISLDVVGANGVQSNAIYYNPATGTYQRVATAQGALQLQVGISFIGAQPDLRLVRVLYSNQSYPSSQFGGNAVPGVDSYYPNEAWSDWLYNGSGSHGDGSQTTVKRISGSSSGFLGATAQTNIANGTYYFSAWAQDTSGNWSDAATNQLTVSSANQAATTTKEQTFLPTYSGSYAESTGWTTGDLLQQGSPQSRGLYFYGTKPGQQIGYTYGNGSVQVQTAYVYLIRTDNTGQPTANLTGFLHTNADPTSITTPLSETLSVSLGTLSVGQGAWFQLPSSWYPALIADTNLGIGFSYKDANSSSATASDYSVLAGNSDVNFRAGQLRINWTETSS